MALDQVGLNQKCHKELPLENPNHESKWNRLTTLNVINAAENGEPRLQNIRGSDILSGTPGTKSK